MAFYVKLLLYLWFHLTVNPSVTGTVETKGMADRISEDSVAKLQEKAEPTLAVKGKKKKKVNRKVGRMKTWLPWKV